MHQLIGIVSLIGERVIEIVSLIGIVFWGLPEFGGWVAGARKTCILCFKGCI